MSLVKGAKRLLKAAKQGVNRAGTEWDKEETAWQEEEERNLMCSCRAHECENEELYVTVLGRLVTIAVPLTDDTGKCIGNSFIAVHH